MSYTNTTTYCYRHSPTLMKSRNMQEEVEMNQLKEELSTFSQESQSLIKTIWSFYEESNKTQRLVLLKGILALSCTSQLSYIARTIQPMIRADFTAILPTEITKHIFSLLDASSLCAAAQVSKRWYQLAEDDALWHHMCEQHINKKCTKCGWTLPLLIQKRKKMLLMPPSTPKQSAEQQQQLVPLKTNKRRRCDDDFNVAQPPSTSPESTTSATSSPSAKRIRRWKQIYQERLIVERNWRRKEMKLTTRNLCINPSEDVPRNTITAQSNNNVPLNLDKRTINAFQFCEAQNILITTGTGSEDNVIFVWNLESNQLIRTLKGHTRTIRTLQFDDTKLVTGALDNTIRIWNYHQRPEEDAVRDPCIRILYGSARMMEDEHADRQPQQPRLFGETTLGISHLHFQGHLLAAVGYHDKTIQVWNFETGECFRLTGHTGDVNYVRLVQREDEACSNSSSKKYQLLSASQDSTIRVWDLEKDNRQCALVLKGHMASVEMVIPNTPGSVLPLSLLNKQRNSVETDTNSNKQQETLNDTILISSSLDNTIKIWSLSTGKCLHTLFGLVYQGIQFLAFDKSLRRLVSGSKDGSLKLWDIETGLPMYSLIEADGGRGRGETAPAAAAAITGVQISDTRIVSTNDKGQLSIWDYSAAVV